MSLGKYYKILAIVFVFSIPFLGSSQTYKFMHFGVDEGINTHFIYTINQDVNGYLLVGTDEGLYKYDGFKFQPYYVADGLADNFIRCSLRDQNGILWFGHEMGGVTKYKDGIFTPIDLSEHVTSRINNICQDNAGNIWVITQNDGLIMIDEKTTNVRSLTKGIEEYNLYDLEITEDSTFLLGTDLGLLIGKVDLGFDFVYDFVDEIIETKVSVIDKTNLGEYLVGTEDEGVFKLKQSESIFDIKSVEVKDVNLADYSVNSLSEDAQGNIWISSNFNGLIELCDKQEDVFQEHINYNHGGLIGTKSIRLSFTDREHNVWIATIGGGLVKLVDDYFSFYRFEDEGKEVLAVLEDEEGLWLGTEKSVVRCNKNPWQVVKNYTSESGLPEDKYRTTLVDEDSTVWAGSIRNGLFYLEPGNEEFKKFELPNDRLTNRINDILQVGKYLWIATDFGIYQIKDGGIKSHMTMQSGLPHNAIKSLFKDSKGRVWIATRSREVTYVDQLIRTISTPFGDARVDITCFTEDNNGAIWASTSGSGVFKVGGEQHEFYSKLNGLFSDYSNSIICDDYNQIWVGHRGGLSKISINKADVEIFDTGVKEKLDFSPNAMTLGSDDLLWSGTNAGLLRYDHEKDVINEHEPVLSITSLNISDSIYDIGKEIDLGYGKYKMRFDFVGVSFKNAKEVTYKYFLDGYDTEWSDHSNNNFAIYPRLEEGEYTFKVMAFNSDGVGGRTLKEIPIFIDKPIWKKWWFVLFTVFFVVLIIRYIIYKRERIMKENQERLQVQLNDRTKEVVDQKEQLELKNKDITDSIVYAKNIQKAMLPAPGSLNDYFKESFVFFKPRDIVSGDFYWVEEFDDKILLACADCTGHGVPGAFMSLIGSALLKEVAWTKKIKSPSEVLQHLDKEINAMLNDNNSQFGVQDGMDISVIEFDRKSKVMRAASAKRPIVLYKEGEIQEIRGDRFSVGGSSDRIEKVFTLHELELKDGDMIYQFSDGIADQFGGERGKKMKKKHILNTFEELKFFDMAKQGRLFRQMFFDWKGNHPQVDDVIVVAVKV